MHPPYHRMSENVLFAFLLVALVGWLSAPLAAGLLLPSAGDPRHGAIVTAQSC